MSDTKSHKLSPREQELVNLYTDPDSHTFLNGQQAILATKGYNASTPGSAATMATEILKRPHVSNWVAEELERLGMGAKVRVRQTSNIAQGYDEEIVTEQYDSEGNLTGKQVTRKPIRADIRLKAMERLDKLDGTADMQKAHAQVLSDTLRKLSKRILSDSLRPDSPQPRVVSRGEDFEQELGNDTLASSDALETQGTALVEDENGGDTGSGTAAHRAGLEGGSHPPSDSILSPPDPRQSKTKAPLRSTEHGVVYDVGD